MVLMGFTFFACFSWFLMLHSSAVYFVLVFVLLSNICHLPAINAELVNKLFVFWFFAVAFGLIIQLCTSGQLVALPHPFPHLVVGIMLLSARSFGIGSLNMFPPSSGRIPFNEDPNPNPHSSGPSTPLKNQIYSFSPSKSYSRQSSSSDTDLSLTPKTGKVLPPTLF